MIITIRCVFNRATTHSHRAFEIFKNSTLHDQKKEIDVTKMEKNFFHSLGVQRSPDHVPKVQLFRYVFLIILKHR